ncbi:YiiX/YebB-like N1pC/P60 family cysteine hydrolase [Desmospora profundinema]|uniref:Uncharacterized protein YycO n=1 Tax=Desmospora profundinema TaxID=1571184 RepID=A0ABU1IN22_9BACL|nr:YiiX/YebB-like N1pC/P60 family cysteine hydrolase [Desmospora profundinema]MDR6226168.1 uncharacterized protein YycO [Desmospora profundinema]
MKKVKIAGPLFVATAVLFTGAFGLHTASANVPDEEEIITPEEMKIIEEEIERKTKETEEFNKNYVDEVDEDEIDWSLFVEEECDDQDEECDEEDETGSMGMMAKKKKKKKDIPGAVLATTDTQASKIGGLVGHAGIIHPDTVKSTVESYPDKGVHKRKNNWTKRGYSNVRKMYVKKENKDTHKKAAKFAKKQIGKPYNKTFNKKNRTDKYYCSQLVWKAWKKQGKDLDNDGGPTVWPVDLVKSEYTKNYYKKG